ncbi:hypothetical protein OE88DRAFT_1667916 [Heliocybe sulcata]|uniref:GmrSD restriction endonucleases N-terminal domain-containing protein n=1 Tax=Heliocybe sulcata TaxID=5364 RepID=A0A5C3MLK7_9AGAM|nr:hypothetical protein OE88DRAFT_1667916 [Heliocybe sulcata]
MFSDSEESSLTALSDVDDYEPSSGQSEHENYAPRQRASTANATARAKPGRPRKGEPKRDYVITNALRPPRTTQYTAKSLYDQIIENSIDLDPEYQRDVVWTEGKQSGLIDSILRHYYIPPVIFAVIAQDDGTEQRVCIDGKQRLTAIQRFMDGLIPHKDSFTNDRLYYKQTPGCKTKRRLLPKAYINRFGNEQICCVEYDGLTPDQEREIFQRVQLGVALTPAERMQALNGPLATYVRNLQQSVLGPAPQGFGDTLEWSTERGRAFQCTLMVVYFIEQYPKYSPMPSTDTLAKYLMKDEVGKELEGKIRDMFDVYIRLAADSTNKALFSRPNRLSPIEFVMIGVMIYAWMEVKPARGKKDKDGQWMEKFDLKALVEALKALRKAVREKHADVRANGKVTKTMGAFIVKTVKDMKSGKNAPANEVKQAKRKRKRADSDDEMDGEPLSRSVGKTPTKAAKAKQTTTANGSTSSTAAPPKMAKKKTDDGARIATGTSVAGQMAKRTGGTPITPTAKQATKKLQKTGGVPAISTSRDARIQEKEFPEQNTARESVAPQDRQQASSSLSKPQSAPGTPTVEATAQPRLLPRGPSRQASMAPSSDIQAPSRHLARHSFPGTPAVKPEVVSPPVAFGSPNVRPSANINGSNAVNGSSSGVAIKRELETSLLDRLAPIRRARGVTDPATSRSITPSGAVAANPQDPSGNPQVTRDPRRPPPPALQIDPSQLHSLAQQLQQTAQVPSSGSPADRIQEANIESLLVKAGIQLDNAQLANIVSGPDAGAGPRLSATRFGPVPTHMIPSSLTSNASFVIPAHNTGVSPAGIVAPSPLLQSVPQPWSIPFDGTVSGEASNGRQPPQALHSRSPPRQPRADRSYSDYTTSQTSIDSRRPHHTPSVASYDDDVDRYHDRSRSYYYDERSGRNRSSREYDHDYKDRRDRGRDVSRDRYRYRSRSREREVDYYERRRDYDYDRRESGKSWRTRSKSPESQKRT